MVRVKEGMSPNDMTRLPNANPNSPELLLELELELPFEMFVTLMQSVSPSTMVKPP